MARLVKSISIAGKKVPGTNSSEVPNLYRRLLLCLLLDEHKIVKYIAVETQAIDG